MLSGFYNLDVIAKTGQNLAGILPDTSINDNGKVAFIGQYSGGGEGVFWGIGGTPTDISFSTYSADPSRSYGPGIQINNQDQVAVLDSAGGERFLRTWDANGNLNSFGHTYYIYANASSPVTAGFDYDSISGSSVSLSNDGNLAFASFDYESNKWQLRLTNATDPADQLTAPQSLHPMAANGGEFVVRDGTTPSSPIDLFGTTPAAPVAATFKVPIADASTGFTALGQSPGISNDGRIVVFYGVDGNGPGIFASVNTTSHGRQMVRIASASANGPISKFEPDVRVGVNELNQGAVTVTYVAYDANGHKGVFASRLTFEAPANAPKTNAPELRRRDTICRQRSDSCAPGR